VGFRPSASSALDAERVGVRKTRHGRGFEGSYRAGLVEPDIFVERQSTARLANGCCQWISTTGICARCKTRVAIEPRTMLESAVMPRVPI